MAIYIVHLTSADGQQTACTCTAGKTQRECVRIAEAEVSASYGSPFHATATTNLKRLGEEPSSGADLETPLPGARPTGIREGLLRPV